MANRNFNTVQAFDRQVKLLNFHFQINGVSNPDNISALGYGVFSVIRISAGLFEVTLQDQFVSCQSAFSDMQCPSAEAIWSQIASESISVDKKIRIRTINSAGAATDPVDNDIVHLQLALRNSTVR